MHMNELKQKRRQKVTLVIASQSRVYWFIDSLPSLHTGELRQEVNQTFQRGPQKIWFLWSTFYKLIQGPLEILLTPLHLLQHPQQRSFDLIIRRMMVSLQLLSETRSLNCSHLLFLPHFSASDNVDYPSFWKFPSSLVGQDTVLFLFLFQLLNHSQLNSCSIRKYSSTETMTNRVSRMVRSIRGGLN